MKQIFIVEDEALLLCELEDLVVQLGYQLAGSATSLDKAMDKLAGGPMPDLALLDLNLNGLRRRSPGRRQDGRGPRRGRAARSARCRP